ELYQRSLYQSVRSHVRQGLAALRKSQRKLAEPLQDLAQRVLDNEDVLLNRSREQLVGRRLGGLRARCHAHIHLRHVLLTGRDVLLVDFEGELGRPFTGRSIKTSPLRDVAGLIRSLHYAGHAVLLGKVPGMVASVEGDHAQRFVDFWFSWSAATLLKSYLETARGSLMLPPEPRDVTGLLEVHLLERACVELQEELELDSDWVSAPLDGILALLNR
ncbi:MAG: alpha-amylase, partial [Planctomycetes bacterium]|nr:alpha-amylase [Planctomycetota bacterium]